MRVRVCEVGHRRNLPHVDVLPAMVPFGPPAGTSNCRTPLSFSAGRMFKVWHATPSHAGSHLQVLVVEHTPLKEHPALEVHFPDGGGGGGDGWGLGLGLGFGCGCAAPSVAAVHCCNATYSAAQTNANELRMMCRVQGPTFKSLPKIFLGVRICGERM
jgi:hypothetical protein